MANVNSSCEDRWDRDPWAIGAYSCLTVDSTEEDPEILRQSVDNRVFFAGEATNYKYQGGLQAAYLTGMCGTCRGSFLADGDANPVDRTNCRTSGGRRHYWINLIGSVQSDRLRR
jgi:hypothetical protein